MQPLRVTIQLGQPLARGAYPLLLDGLLAAAVVENELSLCDDPDDTRPVDSLCDELPLASQLLDGHRVWCASAWMPLGRVRPDCTIDHYSFSGPTQPRILTRKTDTFDFSAAVDSGAVQVRGVKAGEIGPYAYDLDTSRGLFKNVHMTYSLKSVPALEAWCIGDPDLIEGYLREVDYIGPKRRLGHGKVRSLQIVPDERAHTLWKLRPLPGSSDPTEEGIPVRMPARAPYWSPENTVEQRAPSAIFW